LGIPDRFLANKISFGQKTFRSAKTKVFLGKQDFIRQKQNIFSENNILSGQDKTFSGQKRLCPAKTKYFLPRRNLSTQTEKEVSMGEGRVSGGVRDFV